MKTLAILLCLLALTVPAAAQSLFLEPGESAPSVAAGWYTYDDWNGVVGALGYSLKGEADFLLQFSREEDDSGVVGETWTPAVRLHIQRPTAESPVGLALELGLGLGKLKRHEYYDGRWHDYDTDIQAVTLAGRLALAPPEWVGNGYFYLAAGVQAVEVGHTEGEAYPVTFGVAHRIVGELLGDVSVTAASQTEQLTLSAAWIF